MERRTVLAALATAGFGGCTAVFGGGTELLRVSVTNMFEEARSVEVRVKDDGDVVEESTHELGPNEGTVLDCSWSPAPGRFVVAGRLAGEEEWTERDLADLDAECVTATVNVHMSGALQLLVGRGCDPPGETC